VNRNSPVVPIKLKNGKELRIAVQGIESDYWLYVESWRSATSGPFPDLGISPADVAWVLADLLWRLCAHDANAKQYWHQQTNRARIMSKFATRETWTQCVGEIERQERMSTVWHAAYRGARLDNKPHEEATRVANDAQQSAMKLSVGS
jgi:hypothetical protein